MPLPTLPALPRLGDGGGYTPEELANIHRMAERKLATQDIREERRGEPLGPSFAPFPGTGEEPDVLAWLQKLGQLVPQAGALVQQLLAGAGQALGGVQAPPSGARGFGAMKGAPLPGGGRVGIPPVLEPSETLAEPFRVGSATQPTQPTPYVPQGEDAAAGYNRPTQPKPTGAPVIEPSETLAEPFKVGSATQPKGTSAVDELLRASAKREGAEATALADRVAIEQADQKLRQEQQAFQQALAVSEVTGQWEGKESFVAQLKRRLVQIEEQLAQVEKFRVERGLELVERGQTLEDVRERAKISGITLPSFVP